MNQIEWEEWFRRFKKPLDKLKIQRLDESKQLKKAIAKGNYREAEEIAFQVVTGLYE